MLRSDGSDGAATSTSTFFPVGSAWNRPRCQAPGTSTIFSSSTSGSISRLQGPPTNRRRPATENPASSSRTGWRRSSPAGAVGAGRRRLGLGQFMVGLIQRRAGRGENGSARGRAEKGFLFQDRRYRWAECVLQIVCLCGWRWTVMLMSCHTGDRSTL